MNVGLALGALALLLNASDAPEIEEQQVIMNIATNYKPDTVYAGVSTINESLTYVGGATWQTGSRWGLGAEYRHTRDGVTAQGRPHELNTHTGGFYLYRQLPDFGDLSIRTDFGAGVVFFDSPTMQASETWVASARAVAILSLSDTTDVIGWFGGVLINSMSVLADGRRYDIPQTDYPEVGFALQLHF